MLNASLIWDSGVWSENRPHIPKHITDDPEEFYRHEVLIKRCCFCTRGDCESGKTVSRAIGNAVSGILIDNDVIDDGTALFHVDHGNLTIAATPAQPNWMRLSA